MTSSPMSSDPWEEMTRRWREMYDEQAALTRKSWLDGQAQLATALAGGATSDAPASAAGLTELWRSWTTFGDSLFRVWPGVGDGRAGPAALGALPESVVLSLAGGGAVRDALRQMAEGPRLADVGAPERVTARVMELWLAVQKSARDYERVVASAWVTTNSRFAEELSQRYRAAEATPDAKESLRLWMDVANRVLLETNRSQKFLAAQRQLLRDGLDFTLAEREFVEALVEPAGQPTRTEIDEVHRAVHDLKRRVKALEKASAAPPLDQPSAPATAATDRRRRATSKGKKQ
jgi:polyhydroxyalkanoate synthase subunit PhaE